MDAFKVGLMAIATLMAVVYMSIKITSNQSGFGDYVSYRTIVKDASGIFPKTSIRVAGISSGKIQKIELQGNTALITFKVLKKVKITVGSKLKIKSVGFLGDKYLEIKINESTNEIIAEMGLVESDSGGGFETLAKDASGLLKELTEIAQILKADIAPIGGERPIKLILEEAQKAIVNARVISESLKEILQGNEEKFAEIVDIFQKFSLSLRQQTDATSKESLVAEAKRIMKNIEKMTNDLSVVANNIKNGRGTIGKLLSEDQIADEIKETMSSVKKIVKKVDSIRTELSLFTGINSEYGGDTGLGLRIHPSPERFYHLGVSTSEIGVEKEKETVTTINGVKTVENKKVRERDSYRLNVQLGRKLHNFVFRGGLIDSTGGLGVDYEREDWGSKFVIETFNYGKDNTFNLRLGSELHLWNVFYGKITAEDLINDSRNYTISMGLRFMDEDLKGLLGFMF